MQAWRLLDTLHVWQLHLPCPRLQEKNVGSDELAGKVGRIYMPAQDVGSMALHKMKVRAGAADALQAGLG